MSSPQKLDTFGGISFLGAGMIFVHKNMIIGLTTAAGIWATSGIGMAIGAGMYAVGNSALRRLNSQKQFKKPPMA